MNTTIAPASSSSASDAATKAASRAASGSGTAASNASTAAEQQDRFMQLLVAQMKNQDPLNPMDNAQMTSQIAQINTVGGIEKLNTNVQALLASFNALKDRLAPVQGPAPATAAAPVVA